MTAERRDRLLTFLDRAGWAGATRARVAGDASSRSYLRLTAADGTTAILMDAPPDSCGSQAGFVRIAAHLRELGLAAPEVLAADIDAGFLLMEDLGDTLFATAAARSPEAENRVYQAAIDVLVHLHQPPPRDVPHPGAAELADMAGLVFTHYCRGAGQPVPDGDQMAFLTAFGEVLGRVMDVPVVLALRDYHAENLVWRPRETGLRRAGLLDFQDAFAGHPAYDVVSLLQDARRDISPDLEQAMIARYLHGTGLAAPAFMLAYHAIGVQRHLRILGVFARLSLEAGKPHYLAHLPRTWAHLHRALAHPDLADLAEMLRAILPAPRAEVLNRLGAP